MDIEAMLKREVKRLLKCRGLSNNSIRALRNDTLDVMLDISWDQENNLTITYSEYLRFIDPREIKLALSEEIKHYHECLKRKSTT